MSNPIYGKLIRRIEWGPKMGKHVVVDTDVPVESIETQVDAGVDASQILERLRPWHRRLPSLAILERMRGLRDAFCRKHRIGRFDDRGWGRWGRPRATDIRA